LQVLQGADRFKLDEVLAVRLTAGRALRSDESIQSEDAEVDRADMYCFRGAEGHRISSEAGDKTQEVKSSEISHKRQVRRIAQSRRVDHEA
jgi:hypothetical protein